MIGANERTLDGFERVHRTPLTSADWLEQRNTGCDGGVPPVPSPGRKLEDAARVDELRVAGATNLLPECEILCS